MRIGLDIDGVIYDWHDAVYTEYVSFHNYTGTFNEFWLEYVPNLEVKVQDYIVSVPVFYDQAYPTADAVEMLPLLAELGELYYVTSRPESVRLTTELFMRKHKLPHSFNLFMTSRKDAVVRLAGLDVFLDDNAENVESLADICLSVLFKRPWNVASRDNFPCVGSLKEFYNLIK